MRLNLAVLAERRGRFDEARARYREALRLDPDYALALAGLIDLAHGDLPADVPKTAQAILGDPGVDEESKTVVHYALARFNDRSRDADRAFDHARQANESRKVRNGAFDAAQHAAMTAAIKRVFDAAFFREREAFGRAESAPIFIVGMPRSGTTLAEQIVSSHPDVAAAGEFTHYALYVHDLPKLLDKGQAYPDCMYEISAEDIDLLARAYLKGLADVAGPSRYVTNKLPFNFMRLGLIALMFPNAKIVHCSRDPIDTCLSIYMQNFDPRQAWATDLEDLGTYYRSYRDIMEHWSKCLPSIVFELNHENLVADPEERIAALLDFLDLEWDDRCLRFYENPRPVATPSVWQVRQPIYRSSSGRWRRYQRHLEPLLETLK